MRHHYIHTLISAAVSFLLCGSLVGCLGEHPRDQIPEEKAFDSATSLYVNAVASLYNYIGSNQEGEGLQGTCRGIYDYNTLTTDEAIIPIRGGNWYDGGLWQNMYEHKWTATDTDLYNVWKYLYKVIVLSTGSLETIDRYATLLTGEQREAYRAEVRAVRAMFYFYAMDMFGRVPIVESTSQTVSALHQSERSDVYAYVVKELQEALPYLPDGRSNQLGDCYGRVTKAVAWFLLAKLALNAEVYDDDVWTDNYHPVGRNIMFDVDGRQLNAWEACMAYCDKIEDSGYRLSDDYASNFAVHNETSVENIFTIPMDKSLFSNEFHYLFRSRHYAHGGAYGGASENGTCATIFAVQSYGYGTDEVDARFAVNYYSGKISVDGKPVMLDNGEQLEYMPLAVEKNLTASPYIQTAGARMKKYEVDRTAYADGRLPDNDIVLFRFADVLLMRAEAAVRNGGDGQSDLDAVRRRVGMGARPATLDNILAERLLELSWEGWRRQDLIRFGRFTKAYDLRTPVDNEETGFTTVFPIPEKCIELNGNFRQNTGYDK